jgi:hypothetical protein
MSRRSSQVRRDQALRDEDEVNQAERARAAAVGNQDDVGENNPELPPPPPPAAPDLMAILDRQTRLLELLTNVLAAQGNNGNLNLRPNVPQNNNRIADFNRLNPPKFGGSDNPIEADDWIREIEMKLEVVHADDRDKVLLAVQQLRGPALAWWQSYREMNEDANTMLWDRFVKLFKEHHIPKSVMKLKLEEFMSLQQGNLSVVEYLHKFTELSRYATEVLKTDEQKQDAFLRGLDPEIRTLLGASVYPDFNTLVNKAITTAKHKEEIKDKKRKFERKKEFYQEKTQKTQHPAYSGSKSHSVVSYKVPTASFR